MLLEMPQKFLRETQHSYRKISSRSTSNRYFTSLNKLLACTVDNIASRLQQFADGHFKRQLGVKKAMFETDMPTERQHEPSLCPVACGVRKPSWK